MSDKIVDVIIIGAGHAGLCVSYYLKKHSITHLVFERGRIGETWRTQRWDSFKLNSTNKYNLLPEQSMSYDDPDAFAFAPEFTAGLENYVEQFSLPVKEHASVVEVRRDEAQNSFVVIVVAAEKRDIYYCRQLVIASGTQNKILIPDFAKNISEQILQLHTSEYKNALQLPQGNVLVVGSAQSGTQIAEDLVRANKKVFLSTGKVGRIPRTYRGRDIYDWLFVTGFYDVCTDEITDPSIFKIKPPQVSGYGQRGKTTSLQSLAKSGVVILGRAEEAEADRIFLEPNSNLHVKYADEYSLKIKELIDNYIKANSISAPMPVVDPDDLADENATCASDIRRLDLKENNITSIIWTTGFSGDFSYLKFPVLNEAKTPKHHNGISEINGLYFIGLPWLRKRKSPIILGISDDAKFIADQIVLKRQSNLG